MISARIAALLTAFTAAISLVSCSMPFSDSSESSTEASTEASTQAKKAGNSLFAPSDSITVDEVREHVQEMLSDLKVSGNSEKISADIDTLLYDIDVCKDVSTRKQLAYYSDFDNTKLEEEYDDSYRTMYIACQLVTYAFAHCNKADEYKSLVSDHIYDEEMIEHYADPSISLKRLERYSEVDFELLDENTDEYYEIYMDEDMDEDEKALKCAELYLDLLSMYDPESFYDSYNRDYTPEKAVEICDIAYKMLDPSMEKLKKAFLSDKYAYDVINEPVDFDQPFETIQGFADKLSPDIKAAADRIIEKKHYCITDDEVNFPGAFTSSLPLAGDSAIFMNTSAISAVSTAIHEFGHYYAAGFDSTNSYDSVINLDVAEIQSQGFEFIFMRFYDEMFGEQSQAMKLYKTLDVLDSVISGFLVGKFEYTVLSRRDEMTPQDVINCWNDIIGEYTDLQFYEINHLFEAPAYYVSYAVSALAAFDIWEDCLYDPDAAIEKYEKIARIPANSTSTKFLETLEKCGFNDVMTEEYISVLAEEINDYADEIMNK